MLWWNYLFSMYVHFSCTFLAVWELMWPVLMCEKRVITLHYVCHPSLVYCIAYYMVCIIVLLPVLMLLFKWTTSSFAAHLQHTCSSVESVHKCWKISPTSRETRETQEAYEFECMMLIMVCSKWDGGVVSGMLLSLSMSFCTSNICIDTIAHNACALSKLSV